MARGKGKGALKVSVDGLSQANLIPGWLEEGQRRQLELATRRLADNVRLKVGKHARHDVHDRVVTDTRGEITAGRIARVAETGAYIKSKRGPGTALRFGDRFVRFPRGTRIPARKAITKGLQPRRRIIQETFNEVFDDLAHLPGKP